MRAAAASSTKTAGDLASGFDGPALIRSLTRLAAGRDCEGVVCGSGFEDRPWILARLARTWPLLGNDADTVSRVKDPFEFAKLCAELGVPHPPVLAACPPDPDGWLRKRAGGSGGVHVQAAGAERKPQAGIYFQQRVAGRAVSLLFVANGEGALPLGFSSQWSNSLPERPARYGGAVRPAGIGRGLKARLVQAACTLACRLRLRGLNSADFLIEGEDLWLIEINPRPGATLDIFDSPAVSLFALHVDACRGVLPAPAPRFHGAVAAATVYLTRRIANMPALDWPVWCADRQSAGSCVDAGEPICTVRAKAGSAALAKGLVEARISAVLAMTQRGER
jgi:predicted ATP-grasp superfamily ATP-dependent carboligase